jgi:hypothetical protein
MYRKRIRNAWYVNHVKSPILEARMDPYIAEMYPIRPRTIHHKQHQPTQYAVRSETVVEWKEEEKNNS